jgi:hypothetical protein
VIPVPVPGRLPSRGEVHDVQRALRAQVVQLATILFPYRLHATVGRDSPAFSGWWKPHKLHVESPLLLFLLAHDPAIIRRGLRLVHVPSRSVCHGDGVRKVAERQREEVLTTRAV